MGENVKLGFEEYMTKLSLMLVRSRMMGVWGGTGAGEVCGFQEKNVRWQNILYMIVTSENSLGRLMRVTVLQFQEQNVRCEVTVCGFRRKM